MAGITVRIIRGKDNIASGIWVKRIMKYIIFGHPS
jgi:hypothetical protein